MKIAELGSNHGGDLRRAKKLIEAACEAGFDAVKVQAFRVDRLFSKKALDARPELRAREKLEVPIGWHESLSRLAHEVGLSYGVTPCSMADAQLVAPWVDWWKVGSYSLLDELLLQRLLRDYGQKQVLISTGMATLEEVDYVVRRVRDAKAEERVRLLHCVSSYPAHPHEANLRSIPFLRERTGLPVGWSDHTLSPFVVDRAVLKYEALDLELHWDLDDGEGPESRHSWTPELIRDLQEGQIYMRSDDGYYACDGKHTKAPTVSEAGERDWRADPLDGLRPLRAVRALLAEEIPAS